MKVPLCRTAPFAEFGPLARRGPCLSRAAERFFHHSFNPLDYPRDILAHLMFPEAVDSPALSLQDR